MPASESWQYSTRTVLFDPTPTPRQDKAIWTTQKHTGSRKTVMRSVHHTLHTSPFVRGHGLASQTSEPDERSLSLLPSGKSSFAIRSSLIAKTTQDEET
jgi:hypothetical protein